MKRLSIIVPCCNEEDAIRLLPSKLYPTLVDLSDRYEVELVLVDDGSVDGTWAELVAIREQPHPWKVVLARHPVNRGLGAALGTGQLHATGDFVATLDADGTYPFSILFPLVQAVESGADIATASPYHPYGGVEGVTATRLLFSRGASILYRVLVDRRIFTWTAMVRVYRADVLSDSISNNSGFLHVAMTLVEARRRGAQVVDVPAVLARRQVGVSKAKVWRITRAHLKYMSSLLMLRATGRLWVSDPARQLEVAGHG